MSHTANAQRSASELICQIQVVSFTMDDLRLFLDTHPDNEEAIECFNDFSEKRNKLVSEYVDLYGPYTSYSMNENCDTWKWNREPMPWEGVC